MNDTAQLPPRAFARRISLREQVTHALRASVVTGEMKPGLVYSAPALAGRFGVSATPVREAMLDLVKEGLIEVVPNKGFQVTEFSATELAEVTEILLLLEPPAAHAAAARATPHDIAVLQTLAEAIVVAAAGTDLRGYAEADREFHGRLLTLGGNDQLVRVVHELRDRTRLSGLASLAERGLLEVTAREHLLMCEQLADGDGRRLAKLLRAHIGHSAPEAGR